MKELTAEIFAAGKWNGMTFNVADLDGIVRAFDKLKDVHKVPLKFGHNNEQPFTDGQPALGWVEKIWVDGEKLFAKFTDVPDAVFNAMSKKLYRHVSIELDMAVKHSDVDYELVLSGVALLGADIPAVNILEDLTAYMSQSKERIAFSGKRKTFTYEDTDMATVEELQAQLATANAKVTALEGTNTQLATEQKRIKFAAEKTTLTATLEDLVKKNIIKPAKREELLNQFKEDDATVERLKFAASILSEGAPMKQDGDQGKQGKAEEGTPDQVIVSRINKMRGENPTMSFSAAKTAVMKADPDMARAYIKQTGEG